MSVLTAVLLQQFMSNICLDSCAAAAVLSVMSVLTAVQLQQVIAQYGPWGS